MKRIASLALATTTLILCLNALTEAKVTHNRHHDKVDDAVSGCLMTDESSLSEGVSSRKFTLNVTEADEVHIVFNLRLTVWDAIDVTIRNYFHDSVDFQFQSSKDGDNDMSTWLVRGSYEVSLNAVNGFQSASLCYRYKPGPKPFCKPTDSRNIHYPTTFIHCVVEVAPTLTHHLFEFNFKYATGYVRFDNSDVSRGSYDFASQTFPLMFTVEPSSKSRRLYFMLEVNSFAEITVPFGYKSEEQEFSTCFSRDLQGFLSEGESSGLKELDEYVVSVPQPGAIVTVLVAPRLGQDLDVFLKPFGDSEYNHFKAEVTPGTIDAIQVWLPAGNYTPSIAYFDDYFGGSLCYSRAKPAELEECRLTDVIFGELYHSYKKCKIIVEPSENDRTLVVEFDFKSFAVAGENLYSISQLKFDYFSSTSPLLIPLAANSQQRRTFVVLIGQLFVKHKVDFSYRIQPAVKTSHQSGSPFLEGCVLEGASGPANEIAGFDIFVPFDSARVLFILSPNSESAMKLYLERSDAKAPATKEIATYRAIPTEYGQKMVIDTLLPRGNYRITYAAIFDFSNTYLCYSIFEWEIPDCRQRDVITALKADFFIQCKIVVPASATDREMVVTSTVSQAYQHDIFVAVDRPFYPKGQFDYSNNGSTIRYRWPFVRIPIPRFESHTFYVLLTGSMQNPLPITFSYKIRSKFWLDAYQSYRHVQPQPSPIAASTVGQTCGHNQYWNAGESYSPTLGIVGGRDALDHEFPWQVSLANRANDGLTHLCGGSVLSAHWILTAGHCCDSYMSITLYFGSNKGFNYLNQIPIQRKVDQVFIHPYFKNEYPYPYDFCLMKLKDSEPLDFSTWMVQPICLPSSCEDTCQPGDRLVLSGYGQVADADGVLPAKLQTVTVPEMSSTDAQDYQDVFTLEGSISTGDVMTNAFDGPLSACRGDSGGPLACIKKGAFSLDGVVSNGATCGGPFLPKASGRVCHALPWIHRHIGNAN